MVWEASNCSNCSESVHSTLKTGFSFIVSTPNYSCRLKVRSPPRHAAPVGRGFRPPSFLAGPLAPVVRVADQPAVVEAREHAASVIVVVVRRVRPERVVPRERYLIAERRARPAHEPLRASLGAQVNLCVDQRFATSRAFASTAAVSNRRPARVWRTIRFASAACVFLLEKPVLQDKKNTTS